MVLYKAESKTLISRPTTATTAEQWYAYIVALLTLQSSDDRYAQ